MIKTSMYVVFEGESLYEVPMGGDSMFNHVHADTIIYEDYQYTVDKIERNKLITFILVKDKEYIGDRK